MLQKKYLRLYLPMLAVLFTAILSASCSRSPALTPPTLYPTATTTVPASTSPNDLSYLVDSDPASIDNSQFPITPVDKLHTTGSPPGIDITTYHLIVNGLVDNPLDLTYDEIRQYPSISDVVLLICPGVFVDNAQWTGVPLNTILAQAGVKQAAIEVIFYAGDGYQRSFSLQEMQREGVFLAYAVDGQTLPDAHGYPLRLVVTGNYGDNWIKWVEHIQIK